MLQEEFRQRNRNKVYDDIVFDSSAISDIHPRLHKVEVHVLSDLGELSRDQILIDGEYFLPEVVLQAEAVGDSSEQRRSEGSADSGEKPSGVIGSWLKKADSWLDKHGL